MVLVSRSQTSLNLLTYKIDRSNGFEKKFFQYQNAAVRKEYESNQWSVEDM